MNRRQMVMALGCLVVSLGVVSSAEAGGRPRPRPRPQPRPTVTQVTVVNKTARNFFTEIPAISPILDPTVGQAQAGGAKVVNAGATAVFTQVTAGEQEIRVTDVTVLNLNNPSSPVIVNPNPPASQQFGDTVNVVANRNTTVEITQPNPNAAPLFNVK